MWGPAAHEGRFFTPGPEHRDRQESFVRGIVAEGPMTSGSTAAASLKNLRGDFQINDEPSGSSEKEAPLGVRLSSLGNIVSERFLEATLHSQYSGLGVSSKIFPLPTSRDPIKQFLGTALDHEVDWVVAICMALNTYWGGRLLCEEPVSEFHKPILENFLNEIHRLGDVTETVEDFDWVQFFRSRTIDYQGDEIKTAKTFSWGNIGPALPREIGVVALKDLCEAGCKHYVENFPSYLKSPEEWPKVKSSRVMVRDSDWGEICRNLVSVGLCKIIPESEVFRVHDAPLLNGMFGVEKGEDHLGTPVYRLIMNLVPLNQLCLGLAADISSLPNWLGMNPFSMQPSEGLVVSSEDVRCFFYTLRLPESWLPYLAFNKPVPEDLVPPGVTEPCYISSAVLPMGFLNSVGIAQHVHRVLVKRSSPQPGRDLHSREIRKDAPLPSTDTAWRVYLDNYDLLEKFPLETLGSVEGTIAEEVEGLRGSYALVGMPRHTGKSVSRKCVAEVQGAIIDGRRGLAYPKGAKLIKYVVMALMFCQLARCSQKQAQVVCGGLVYFSMFRRQLLGGLNQCWSFIQSFETAGVHTLCVPPLVKMEILRFVCLVPLCRMDFRLTLKSRVTCSDASTSGGGLCSSLGLSPSGHLVANGALRPEGNALDGRPKILSIGLFDGIGCLRVALDLIGAQVLGHISVEKEPHARRVVEYHFPGCILRNDVVAITEEDIRQWSLQFGQADLVLLGGGPPCQGVSGLNASRRGALLDERSNLFIHVARIRSLLRKFFKWCPIYSMMESVASMDDVDKDHMSASFEDRPWYIDSENLTWCRRPRLYWVNWELHSGEGAVMTDDSVILSSNADLQEFISKGWTKVDPGRAFPTFTTSRPRPLPGRKPAGIHHCDEDTLSRWRADDHRYPPYQYLPGNCLTNKKKQIRLPNIDEKELLMGLPLGYTNCCSVKSQRKSQAHLDARHSLVGNAWCVPVIAWLLSQLLGRLGFVDLFTPQEIMDRLDPSKVLDVRSKLLRQTLKPVGPPMSGEHHPVQLVELLSRLVSAKGEDILLNSSSDQIHGFQRLRQTVPAKLWRWQVISGWKWKLSREHINVLELRALEASIRWRVERLREMNCKFIHLTDSLVCLHTVSRGRSSSKKLRRCVCRLNAVLLASGVSPVWGYVHTDQNPADRPSRWKVRTKFRNAKGSS